MPPITTLLPAISFKLQSFRSMAFPSEENPKLPIEIIDLILEEFIANNVNGSDALPTIASCRFVSRFFAHKCGKALFHTIPEISSRKRDSTKVLFQLINDRPEIAEWIRSLTCYIGLIPGMPCRPPDPDPCASLVWPTLCRLPNLKSLSIIAGYAGPGIPSQRLSYTPSASSASNNADDPKSMLRLEISRQRRMDVVNLLDTYLPTPNLRYLKIKGVWNLPSHAFLACTNLRILELERCTFGPISSSISLLQDISSRGSIQDLRVISPLKESPTTKSVIRLLLSLNPHLKSITLAHSDSINVPWPVHPSFYVKLPILHAQNFPFRHLTHMKDGGWLFLWPQFCDMAREIGSALFPALKVLDLVLTSPDQRVLDAFRLLSHNVPYIEDLSITFGSFDHNVHGAAPPLEAPDFLPFFGHHLKKFQIYWITGNLNCQYLITICNTLKSISSTTTIENISISLFDPIALENIDWVCDFLEHFDSAVGGSDASFFMLKEITVRISPQSLSRRVRALLPMTLKRLHRRQDRHHADTRGVSKLNITWIFSNQ
ncbi:hypothetical protein CVT24_013303 [Panaeolus cyanescens]|uniref:F-box domain-containing protein n=1 Tax=Panaeolus cyanescens TaxID=181874 RepID=A0A409YMC2_9AGAR|nr:hypothetical protein CVT24_013303 [Panaeolus cyanescens]